MPRSRAVSITWIGASLSLTLGACGTENVDLGQRAMGQLETGISISLARERAESIRNLRYTLALGVPEAVDDPVDGHVTAQLSLRDASAPLILDFAPAFASTTTDEEPVRSVTANGVAIDFDHVNGHVVVPRSALVTGENTIEIEFRAGDAALNRTTGLVYSLFVPALAHTVFPVFDQPDLKARFSLELTVPPGWVAVSNGPETGRETAPEGIRIRYGETEPIPTYLLAFAAGELQIEAADRGGRTFRMFHRESDAEKVRRNRDTIFDLHATALEQLEAYTGIPYPFGKFDFVLVPAFQFGGMEHPGAIYYRDSGLLLDESATQQDELSRASVIAHETAHMWFGDLVTMQWFDDVWMKEVFANFMAEKLVNPSFPDVNHDLLFLTGNYPSAYGVDRTEGTHPIRQALGNLSEAGSLYGAIIYQKAPIVMRQLERLLGEAAFREGVRDYLDDFRFGNATWLDLIDRLDERTPLDLARWSRSWVEEAGRVRIRTELDTDGDGRVSTLALVQSDPIEGRNLLWTQQIEVLVGTEGGIRSFPVELDGARTEVAEAVGLAAEFVLPTGGGLAYGDVVLDAASRRYLLERFAALDDPLTRGAAWVTLWEEMLDARVPPEALVAIALDALPREETEQLVELMLGGMRTLFWRYLSASQRAALAPELEALLRSGFESAGSTSLKSAYFSTFRDVVTTPAGIALLEDVWRREVTIPRLPFSETDETAMAEALALRAHPQAAAILVMQLERIANADRRARLEFIRPALSTDATERAAFFASLADPAMRRREPWVLDGLSYLHHPLRAAESRSEILPALEMLEEIRDTGDIFFPGRWIGAVLAGHNSPEAAATVRAFVDGLDPDYPIRLRRIVLQAADPLFRSVEILDSD